MEVVGAAASAEAPLTVRIFKTRTGWRMGDEKSIMVILMKYVVEYTLEGEGEVILEGRICGKGQFFARCANRKGFPSPGYLHFLIERLLELKNARR